MNTEDVIRTWKDPEFRSRTALDDEHPAGSAQVPDFMLKNMGGASYVGTSNNGCTCGGGTFESGCTKCEF